MIANLQTEPLKAEAEVEAEPVAGLARSAAAYVVEVREGRAMRSDAPVAGAEREACTVRTAGIPSPAWLVVA